MSFHVCRQNIVQQILQLFSFRSFGYAKQKALRLAAQAFAFNYNPTFLINFNMKFQINIFFSLFFP